MDKSFTSGIFASKSPFSPRARQSAAAKRSIAPPAFRKSTRLSISGRSTQSAAHVILKTAQHTVERFGQPLTVLVTEALTFAERSTVVSARISSECGYAWLVCGRRLLIWQYKQSPPSAQQPGTPSRRGGGGGITNQCYELQLPQSDLAHRAELVTVFLSSTTGFPACIAVSPEGVVRYWPAIAHEGMSIEQQIDLQGQECDSLTSVEGLGCVLATTTCTVVLVQRIESPRPALVCHTLKTPSGWLGGLSKRMSSLIFGPNSTETSAETRLVRVLAVPFDGHTAWNVYVLAGHSLQKWKLSTQDAEEFLYVEDLTRPAKEGFFNTFWENCGGEQGDIDLWILDLQPDTNGGGIVLLAAAMNAHISPQMHYALIHVNTTAPRSAQFSAFNVLKLSGLYSEQNPAETLGYRFLLGVGNAAYIYNHRCITVVRPHEEPDCLEFNAPQDFLLGGSICVNTPVFFSRNGLVAVIANDMELNNSVMSAGGGTPLENSYCDASIGNLTLYSFNPEEMQATYVDAHGQLKAAFVYHVTHQTHQAMAIIAETFAIDDKYAAGSSVDAKLDREVVALSRQILDDTPANDPHWTNKPVGLGSSNAMQVVQQLDDKKESHGLFVKFLKDCELWRKLGAVSVRGTMMATTACLAENTEKIIAAVALRHRPHDDVLQRAIEVAADALETVGGDGVSKQSLFYSHLNQFQSVINELVAHCDRAAQSHMNPGEIVLLIKETNAIVLDVLKRVLAYRQSHAEYFEGTRCECEYLPWTAASGREGCMDALILQTTLTYNYGAKAATEYAAKQELYEQLVVLVDVILDARKSHLQSVTDTANEEVMLKQYVADRKRLIEPLVAEEQWDGAATLAEKYLDFETLIQICERTDNQSRLDTYVERFQHQDFSTFLCNWFLQENQPGKLIDYCNRRDTQTPNEIRCFLAAHPTLAWIQHTFDKAHKEAADTLSALAYAERDSLTRQKTMVSLAKLSALAAGRQDVDEMNRRLELIQYQEEIPDYVLQQYGYDSDKPAVIPVKDLIHFYTCVEYADATEVDFKKALDLLSYVDDEEMRKQLALDVWKSAILRDRWDDANLDAPIEVLKNKLMFKLVDLAVLLGADPRLLLPPIGQLLNHSELLELQRHKSFEYLIRTGYEHISRVTM